MELKFIPPILSIANNPPLLLIAFALLEAGIAASRLGLESLGRGWSLQAIIWSLLDELEPQCWSWSLEARIGDLRLRLGPRGWNLSLKGGGGHTEKKEKENFSYV